MDDLDRQILRLLRADGRATNLALGRRLGLTEGAVRYRIRRLVATGALLKFTVVTRPLGPDGLVLVRCRPGTTERVVDRARRIAEEVFETSGEYDLAATVQAESMEGFNRILDRLRAIPGVEKTTTLVRLTRLLNAERSKGRTRPPRAPRRPRRTPE